MACPRPHSLQRQSWAPAQGVGPQTYALCHTTLPGLWMRDHTSLTDLLWGARPLHCPTQAGSPEPPGLTPPSHRCTVLIAGDRFAYHIDLKSHVTRLTCGTLHNFLIK